MATAPACLLLDDDAALYPALVQGLTKLAAITHAGPPTTHAVVMFRDALSHRRDIYHPLVVHLHLAALHGATSMAATMRSAAIDLASRTIDSMPQVRLHMHKPAPPAITALLLWQALCLDEVAMLTGDSAGRNAVVEVVEPILADPGEGGSLHPQDPDESLDAWTYRELCGLHALYRLAIHAPPDRATAWMARVAEITRFHVDNTQPDNTTNQPWAWAAFAARPETRSFAVQQLHDASAHGVSLVAAMLLADALHAGARRIGLPQVD